jgi:hypothetical protein
VQRLVAGGGGLTDQPPLITDQHDQEDGQGDNPGAAGDHGRRDQGVLASSQLGQGGGRLRLFAGRQRNRRLPQVDVGPVDPLQVDLVGRPQVLASTASSIWPYRSEAPSTARRTGPATRVASP